MTFKTVLLHMNEDKNIAARLDLAIAVAKASDANLVGLHVTAPAYVPPYLAGEIGSSVFETQRRIAAELSATSEQAFMKAADKAGLQTVWRTDEGFPAEVVSMHARYADIAIVGQADPDEGPNDVAETVVLESGTPGIIVPYAGRFERLGERVLIAWNASREAARAVKDALPFLVKAKAVTVMVVNPKTGPTAHGDVPGSDMALFLARHGVKAEATQVFADDIEVGDILLSRAADLGIDLLVMGAYGRSRLTELVLGGATRQVLGQMTVPVLMAH